MACSCVCSSLFRLDICWCVFVSVYVDATACKDTFQVHDLLVLNNSLIERECLFYANVFRCCFTFGARYIHHSLHHVMYVYVYKLVYCTTYKHQNVQQPDDEMCTPYAYLYLYLNSSK